MLFNMNEVDKFPGDYKCSYCNKQYTRKIFFERHELCCRMLHESERERKITNEEATSTPTVTQLYIIVQELSKKVQSLERDNATLQQFIKRKMDKCNITDWLNKNRIPSIDFNSFIKQIKVERSNVESILANSLDFEIYNMIKNYVKSGTKETLPICCFTQKKDTFYIYNGGWKTMESSVFIGIIKNIQKEIMKLFETMYIEEKKATEDIFEQTQKIMGGHKSFQRISSSIEKKIFDDIKFDVKSMIQYEF